MVVVTFPRALPSGIPLIGVSFKPFPMNELTPLRSGKQIGANLGPRLWKAEYNSGAMDEEKLGVVRGWYDTLDEGINLFYGYDLLREYPYAYRATGWTGLLFGGNPFNGNGIITAVAANNVEVTIDNLPVGFVLTVGDYFAFDYGGDSRALHRVSVGGTAGAGNDVTVEVRPHVRPGWDGNSPLPTVYLYRPAARMLIVPGSYSDPVGVDRNALVSFQAIQSL